MQKAIAIILDQDWSQGSFHLLSVFLNGLLYNLAGRFRITQLTGEHENLNLATVPPCSLPCPWDLFVNSKHTHYFLIIHKHTRPDLLVGRPTVLQHSLVTRQVNQILAFGINRLTFSTNLSHLFLCNQSFNQQFSYFDGFLGLFQ